jgi:predicted nucleic acid-binding protein
MRFIDTNILLYAISTDASERRKKQTALALLDEQNLTLSVQVLQEFYVQATRPTRDGSLTHEQATNLIESWLRFPVQEITRAVFIAALAAKKRWKLSYWDAAILESARAADCREILTEDLQHGANFGGVRIRNPFK